MIPMQVTETKIGTEIKTITPEVASRWLSYNKANRPVSMQTVRRYAEIMKRGEWMLTGEPIIFSDDGVLVNGQHRLKAIINAGVTVDILVVYNVKPEVFDALDQGKPRSAGDILAIRGEKQYNRLAAALRVILAIQKHQRGEFTGRSVMSQSFTPIQVEQCLEKNPSARYWIDKTRTLVKIADGGLVAGLFTLFGDRSPVEAEMFCDELIEGIGSFDSPAMILRNRLMQNKANKTKVTPTEAAVWVIKSWNAYKQGKRIGILKWQPDETFPKIL